MATKRTRMTRTERRASASESGVRLKIRGLEIDALTPEDGARFVHAFLGQETSGSHSAVHDGTWSPEAAKRLWTAMPKFAQKAVAEMLKHETPISTAQLAKAIGLESTRSIAPVLSHVHRASRSTGLPLPYTSTVGDDRRTLVLIDPAFRTALA